MAELDFSEEMAAVAVELLQELGTPVTLYRPQTGAMTASGDRAPAAAASEMVDAVLLPERGKFVQDGIEKVVDKMLTTAVVGAWPKPGDSIVTTQGQRIIAYAKNWAPVGTLIYSDLGLEL